MKQGSFIDTHAHLYLSQFDEDIQDVIQRAVEAGVSKILLPNINLETISSMNRLTVDYPGVCYAMMGLHPCSVDAGYDVVLKEMESLLSDEKWIGIGETGVDLYWDKTFLAEQIQSFRRHIAWAKELQLPVIIHSRDSLDLNIGIVEELQDGSLTGVFHCFNGDAEQAHRIADTGMMMGLGGVITFKNAGMKSILPAINKDHIVLETDAPYLTAVPNRGKRNEIVFLLDTAQYLADCLDMPLNDIAALTTRNALKLFSRLNY